MKFTAEIVIRVIDEISIGTMERPGLMTDGVEKEVARVFASGPRSFIQTLIHSVGDAVDEAEAF